MKRSNFLASIAAIFLAPFVKAKPKEYVPLWGDEKPLLTMIDGPLNDTEMSDEDFTIEFEYKDMDGFEHTRMCGEKSFTMYADGSKAKTYLNGQYIKDVNLNTDNGYVTLTEKDFKV